MSERFAYDDPKLKAYGRNKGGRYLHKIRGGEFRPGEMNLALCSADVTRPAEPGDYHREVCGACKDREGMDEPWTEEQRQGFMRSHARFELDTAINSLEQAALALAGTGFPPAEVNRLTTILETNKAGLKMLLLYMRDLQKEERQ